MKCKIKDCNKEAVYKERQICQMHYFRYMRNGTYKKIKTRKKFIKTQNGYIKRYLPNHALADKAGYVYEHRYQLYKKIGPGKFKCELCMKDWSWRIYKDHVDHIDNNKQNNQISNLRPLCNGCNAFKDFDYETMSKNLFAVDSTTRSARAWAAMSDVRVCEATILRRRKAGMSDYNCVYGEKVTHKHS